MAHEDLAIKHCLVLQPDFSILTDATILIHQGRITKIATEAGDIDGTEGLEVLDGQGKLALPGFVDGHTHAAQTLLRGSVVDELPMVWARILVPFESALTYEDTYAGAMLFCLQNLRAGITTFADAGGPHMDAVADAAIETGIRAVITRSTMDQGAFVPDSMKDNAKDAIAKTEALYDAYHNRENGRIKIWFGVRQAMTTSPELAEAIADRSKALNTGVHAHLAEHLDEVSHCLSNFSLRPAEWFDRFGLLGPNFIGAHSVRLTADEIRLMAERNANVVHCPTSNLQNHGFSKTPQMMARGINIGLGTDGGSGTRLNLFEQMRLLKNAMQARFGVPINDPLTIPTLSTLKMATQGGARAVMLHDEIGTLEPGKKADIILLNINRLHLSPTADLPKTVVLNGGPDDVSDVIVDGKVLIENGAFREFDVGEIRRKAGEALLRVGKKADLALPKVYIG
jgi:5-methylthioadenosine/S-adenosylhomocysteine deaminase